MSGSHEPCSDFSSLAAEDLERTIEAFEEAWQQGNRPRIEQYLANAAGDSTTCLIELVHIDLEYALKAGEDARVEGYFKRFPELTRLTDAVRDLIATELDLRRRHDPMISVSEYIRRFPQFSKELPALANAKRHADSETTAAPTSPFNEEDFALSAASERDMPAEQIATRSQYHMLHTYAKGGLGEIRLAVDQQLNREVALKLMQQPHSRNPESRRRFLREAEITSHLEHPGIVPVYGLGRDHLGNPVYAMRFIRGESLHEAIERFHAADKTPRDPGERTLAFRNLLTRFLVVCNTIAYAHSRGVLHRDIKPGNIMLGQYGETLVVDWGLAKFSGESREAHAAGDEEKTSAAAPPNDSSPSGTQMGVAIGTPAFMSPEQAAGRWDHVGPASDIYSLGATLYMLLTGQTPRTVSAASSSPRDPVSEKHQHSFGFPHSPSRTVPPALAAICRKALDSDPQKRYPSALHLAGDLEHWLADEPVSAWREPIAVKIYRWLSRHRTLVSGAAAAVLAALVSLAAMTLFLTAANQKARDQLIRADANFYFHRISLADQAWWVNQITQARERLMECKPELRQWEWHLLHRRCREHQTTLPGHSDTVASVAFQPAGQHLASGSIDGTLKIWDAKTGEELQTLLGHTAAVLGIAYHPNGQRLASCSQDGSVIIWESMTGRKLLTLAGPKHGLKTVAYNAKGDILAAGGDDKTVFLWNADNGIAMGQFPDHGDIVRKVEFSPDGRWLASAAADTVRIWDMHSRELLYSLCGHTAAVHALTFSRDGKWLASAGADQTIKIWNTFLGKEVQSFGDLQQAIHALAFSPDNRNLAYGGDDTHLKVVDVSSRETITFAGHRGAIAAVAFHPGGKSIATGSTDNSIKIWDLTLTQAVQNLAGHARLQGLAISPDGKLLATAGAEGAIKIWDRQTWKVIRTLQGNSGSVWGLAFRPDGLQLASCTDKQKVQIWSVPDAKVVQTLSGHANGIAGVAYSPDGQNLAAAGDDGKVLIWDTNSGRQKKMLQGHTDVVWSVAFSPDGKQLATGSADRTVKIWDTNTWKEFAAFREPKGGVLQVGFSPDGKYLAASGGEAADRPSRKPAGEALPKKRGFVANEKTRNPFGEINIWETATWNRIFHLPGHTEPVRGLAFSPDSQRLATASYDGTVKLWNMGNGQEILAVYRYFGPFYGLAFTPDGHQLLGAAWDLKLWDATPLAE
jgi:WD40 repeat protein/serine/threonine protein kinase